MQPPDFESLTQGVAETQADRDALVARIQTALQEGDPEAADELLQEASVRFPDEACFTRLRVKQQKLARRFGRVDSLLVEIREALEEYKFVDALGEYREAANLSRGLDALQKAVFGAGVAEAERLTSRNWRVAEALLNEAVQLNAHLKIPPSIWRSIHKEQREEEIRCVLARADQAQSQGDLSIARERLVESLDKYAGEKRLKLRLQSVETALAERQKQDEQRRARLKELHALREELERSGDLESARDCMRRIKAIADAYVTDRGFAGIAGEIDGQFSTYERAAAALSNGRVRECLEQCDDILSRRPTYQLFADLRERARALEAEALEKAAGEQEQAANEPVVDSREAISLQIVHVEEGSPASARPKLRRLRVKQTVLRRAIPTAIAATLILSALVYWPVRHSQTRVISPPRVTAKTAVASVAAPQPERTPAVVAELKTDKTIVKVPLTPPVTPKIELESRDWNVVQDSKNAADLEDFVSKYPKSRHASEALEGIQQLAWDSVDKQNVDSLRAFLARYPNGPHSEQGREALAAAIQVSQIQSEQSDWAAVDKSKREALASFLDRHPASAHADAAKQLVADLEQTARMAELQRVDDAAWRAANTEDKISIENYRERFPAGAHRKEADQALARLQAAELLREESRTVLDVLDRYTNAWNGKDVKTIMELQRVVDRRVIKAQLAPVRTMTMTIAPTAAPQISGTQATVVCRRQASEIFSDGTEKQSPNALVTFVLAKRNGSWIIEDIR